MGPLMVSHLVFKKPLDFQVLEKLESQYNEKMKKKGWGYWFWKTPVPKKETANSKTPKLETPKVELVREIKIKKSLRPTSEQLV